MTLRARVLDALGGVIDPELDEPVTTLGFVSSCEVSAEGDVTVHLRLPTPQCAPNFAFLMASDARTAARSVARSPRVSPGNAEEKAAPRATAALISAPV